MESAKIIRFQGPNIYTDQNIPDEDKDDFDLIRRPVSLNQLRSCSELIIPYAKLSYTLSYAKH